MKKYLVALLFVSFFFVRSTYAQVVINEMVTYEGSGDWIELYSKDDVDMGSWSIIDDTSEVKKFSLDTKIGPSSNKFLVIDVNNRLNKSGDTIKLLSDDGTTIIDQVSYGDKGGICAPADSLQAIGRETDGDNLWVRFQTSTGGATNNDAPKEPCPSPVPSSTTVPSNTPAPTKTPSPTPIKSAPTKTPIPYSSPTPTIKPTAVQTLTLHTNTEQESDGSVLGVEEKPSPTTIIKGSSVTKGGAKIALVLGMLFIGIAIMVFTQRIQQMNK